MHSPRTGFRQDPVRRSFKAPQASCVYSFLAGCFTDTHSKYNFSFGILKEMIQLKIMENLGRKLQLLNRLRGQQREMNHRQGLMHFIGKEWNIIREYKIVQRRFITISFLFSYECKQGRTKTTQTYLQSQR